MEGQAPLARPLCVCKQGLPNSLGTLQLQVVLPRYTLVRREGSDAFYWAVTDDSSGMATSICFGWPTQVMIAGGNEYFEIRTDITSQDIVPMVVDSLQGWIVQHIRWLAPCAHFASTHQCVLLGVADGVADTALRAAARKAFYGLGRQALYGLGRKLGAEVTWGMKLFDLVLGLVHLCLPDLDDAELYSMLSLRCPRESVWGEFLKTEEAQDLLGDSMDEDCMVVAGDMEKKSAAEGEYTAAFAAHRAKVKALRESAQPKRGGQEAPLANQVPRADGQHDGARLAGRHAARLSGLQGHVQLQMAAHYGQGPHLVHIVGRPWLHRCGQGHLAGQLVEVQ